MIKRLSTMIVASAALLMITASAFAQKTPAAGKMNSYYYGLIRAAKQGKTRSNPEIVQQVRADFAADDGAIFEYVPSVVGTWNCHIPTSDGGNPPFEALQTFGSDGTFVETSSLLGMGGEGPAHGSYERSRRGYILTFELFVFDPATGESVGRVRVRASIRMTSSNSFEAMTVVDFIDLDGTVIPDIDSGPFTATRMGVRGT